MYNFVYLIGRLTAEPDMTTMDTGKKVLSIVLAVQRTYKNADGIYEADFIRCTLWDGIAERASEYCHKGDLIGVRGQIKSSSYNNKDETEKKYVTEVMVERLCFLSTTQSDDSEVKKSKK
jgi:single-strand DNA-binding protein